MGLIEVPFIEGNMSRFLLTHKYAHLIVFIVLSFYIHNFLLVVANFSPVLILLLTMNLIHLKSDNSAIYFPCTALQ